MVHAERDLAEDVLLGVLRSDRGKERLKAGDVTARRRRFDAVVQRHQVGRLGPSSAVAGAADAVGVDLRAGLQVVDASHAVPDLESGSVATEQDAADSERRVRDGAPQAWQGGGHLAPLTLVDRIEDKGRHAVEGQQRSHGLVGFAGFGVGGVAARDEDARIRRGELVVLG